MTAATKRVFHMHVVLLDISRLRVRGGGHGACRPLPLTFVAEMEECALPNDRSAQAPTKLIENQRITRIAAQIVEPLVCIESGIAMEVINAAVKFVRSGTRQ